MKLYKQIIIFILIVFFKTETVFSQNNLFNVNNIKLEKKDKVTNDSLADQAIKKGFNQLIKKNPSQGRSKNSCKLKLFGNQATSELLSSLKYY